MTPAVEIGDKKILVVGGSGFLGRPLVRRLVAQQARVTGTSRHPPAEADGAQWIAGDSSDAAVVAQLFERVEPDIVYILNSDSRGGPDLEFVQPGVRNDVVATINVLAEATRHKCGHVIMTGSLDEPQGLARSAIPSTPYGAAKWVTGGYARMFMRLYETPISILRTMVTYGPGQKSYKIIPTVVEALLQHQPARLGSGKRLIDWVYVDDVVDAYVRTAMHGPLNTTVELGSGTLVSIRDCTSMIGDLLGRSHLLEFDPARDRHHEEVMAADTRPAQTLLGWRATTPLEEGLQKTIAGYKAAFSSTRRDFDQPGPKGSGT